jgi:hypothetical protein
VESSSRLLADATRPRLGTRNGRNIGILGVSRKCGLGTNHANAYFSSLTSRAPKLFVAAFIVG